MDKQTNSPNHLSEEEQQELKECLKIKEMVNTEGWGLFRKFLEAQIRNSWLDPRQCKSKEELAYQYSIAWGSAEAAHNILSFIDERLDKAEYLRKKMDGEQINKFGIGRRKYVHEKK